MVADRPADPGARCCSTDGSPIDAICETVSDRLAQLQPYIDEAARLRAVLDAAGCGPATDRTPAPKTRETPPGHNKQLIAEHLTEHPGSSAAQIAHRAGVKRSVIASTMSRMARRGELERTARGYRLPQTSQPAPTAPSRTI